MDKKFVVQLIDFWISFLAKNNWQELINAIEPRQTGCGIVYELPLISKPGQEFAIVDMSNVLFAELVKSIETPL